MKISSRSGSALLVVLGMLAFMVISAVAFSAYMRYSRLPSSYLRRTTASRELVKAALARAIDEIDHAIGENPHPGVGNKYFVENDGEYEVQGDAYRVESGGTYTKNYWVDHIYIGKDRLASSFEETTPVLTLEGLAYIPPPYVDAARYYGRLSSSAEWKSFDFDAGRYAFLAIDVSDCFDVNRLGANLPRSSGGSGRISLAYLFEDEAHENIPDASTYTQWDTFMENFRKVENDGTFSYDDKVPLVSVADLNMAIGDSVYGKFFSPWYKYVKSGGQNGFYSGRENDAKVMSLVTDSYLPPTNSTASTESDYDLGNPQYQPFEPAKLMDDNTILDYNTMRAGTTGASRMSECISWLGMCSLFDYLDVDSVPYSLAMPTLERSPMIAAIQPELNNSGALVITEKRGPQNVTPNGTSQQIVNQTITYTIDGPSFAQILQQNVKALVAYPFIREDGQERSSSWTVEGCVALYLADDSNPVKMRTGTSDVLHFNALKGKEGLIDNCVMAFPFGNGETVTFSSVNSEDDAVKELQLGISPGALGQVASALQGNPLLTLEVEWVQTLDPNTGQWTPMDADLTGATPGTTIKSASMSLFPLTQDGVKMDENAAIGAIKSGSFTGSNISLSLRMAVSMAIKDSNGKYVDLVPASIYDDNDLNSRNLLGPLGPIANRLGGAYAVLDNSSAFNLNLPLSVQSLSSAAAGGAAQVVKGTCPALVIDDPVFNYEPESWYSQTQWPTPADWIQNVKARYGVKDIFRNTSDQGYMQSVWELAFPPAITETLPKEGSSDDFAGDCSFSEPGSSARSVVWGSANGVRNHNLMWHTYNPFLQESNSKFNDFEAVGFTSGEGGYRINPYTRDLNVMMAAFANTPLDWAAAGTNLDSRVKKISDFPDDSSTFNKHYAWNAENSKARIKYEALEDFADKFMEKICSVATQSDLSEGSALPNLSSATDWTEAWRDIGGNDGSGWRDASDSEIVQGLTAEGSKIYDIDRRFFYGYWKECFAVRQQLFLIFVRAEPMMMGGGSMSRIPPQLGARAVALVWRDPTPYKDAASSKGAPHRTRILFYKPLD